MDPNVKQLVIKGGAVQAYTKERKAPRTTRRSRDDLQEGGFNSAPGPSLIGPGNAAGIRNMASRVRGTFQSGGAAPAPAPSPAPTHSVPSSSSPPPPPPPPALPKLILSPGSPGSVAPSEKHPQTGGAKKKTLVLAPPKTQTRKSKLHLAPPSASSASSASSSSASSSPSKAKRSASTRKIRVHLGGLKKRLCRANTIKKDSHKKPIAEIRRTLEEAKLVKPCADGKEVPESVLRHIYRDYMILRNRVL